MKRLKEATKFQMSVKSQQVLERRNRRHPDAPLPDFTGRNAALLANRDSKAKKDPPYRRMSSIPG